MSEAQPTESLPAVRFQHFPAQHLTMAVLLRPDGLVAVGLAKAGRSDQWSRAKGRQIAEGRARCERDPTRHRYLLDNSGLIDPETAFVHWDRVVATLAVAYAWEEKMLAGIS